MVSEVCTVLGFVLGSAVGLFGTVIPHMLWCKLTIPNYDPSKDYAAALLGILGGTVFALFATAFCMGIAWSK